MSDKERKAQVEGSRGERVSPREQEIGLAWVTHLRECVTLELRYIHLRDQYLATQIQKLSYGQKEGKA